MKLLKRLGEAPFESLLVELTVPEYERIMAHTDFVSACLYGGATTLYPGEVGRLEDMRLVISPAADDEREKMMLDRLGKLTAPTPHPPSVTQS